VQWVYDGYMQSTVSVLSVWWLYTPAHAAAEWGKKASSSSSAVSALGALLPHNKIPTHVDLSRNPIDDRVLGDRRAGEPQGGSSQFPGVLVGPPPTFVKCHQKSTSNSAGWVVRWVLSTPPPGHPAARRCVRVVPVLPLLLCTRPARARPSIGGQSSTPAPRQLPWSPPRGWSPCSRVR
jgi:hypothetical protein